MPIYEYQCKQCSHRLEALQSFSDAPLVECPECGRDGLEKMISAAGFHLKGAGWYRTDYKAKESRRPATDTQEDSAPACGQGACAACTPE
jgi:putative FmdB family regulatory protein